MKTCGPYELLEPIGEGSSGTVFRARRDGSATEVALKRLASPMPSRLLVLVETLNQAASSPHLRQVVEVGRSASGEQYLVFPLLEGGDLETARSAQEDGRVPLRVALRWSIDALKGLEAMHQAGFQHGDIKPSNLMLDSDDRVVVCDFSALTPLKGEWEGDLENGTPEYLPEDKTLWRSPERDLHALGLTLMGLLTGELVKSATDAVPSRYDPLLPAAVDQVVAKAVGAAPRFGSAQEMRQTLESLLGAPAPQLTSLSPPTRRVVWKEKRPARPLWPWLVALLMLPLGAWTRSWQPPVEVTAQSTALWSGVGVTPAVYRNREVWQVLILGRPVAAFSAADPTTGGETPHQRALWCAAVLEEAYFKKQPLKLVSKRELPESCEVYLQVNGVPDKLLFRITPDESKLFDSKAPVIAKVWSTLMADTADLVRPGSRSEQRGPSALLLSPWKSRFETLVGQGGTQDQPTRVRLWWEALESLESERREDILESYHELLKDTKS